MHQIGEHEVLVSRKILVEKGLKAGSINSKIMKPLRMALLRAEKRGLIKENPCRDITNLKEDSPGIDPFSFEELKQFLDALKKKKS